MKTNFLNRTKQTKTKNYFPPSPPYTSTPPGVTPQIAAAAKAAADFAKVNHSATYQAQQAQGGFPEGVRCVALVLECWCVVFWRKLRLFLGGDWLDLLLRLDFQLFGLFCQLLLHKLFHSLISVMLMVALCSVCLVCFRSGFMLLFDCFYSMLISLFIVINS